MRLNIQAKPAYHLALTETMRQGLEVLQMPVEELSQWLVQQIEQNPLLEFKETLGESKISDDQEKELNFDNPSFVTLDELDPSFRDSLFEEHFEAQSCQEPVKRESLYEHLMSQAALVISDPKKLSIAQWIIGNIDERGYYTLPLDMGEEEILKIIQTFDPSGIGARNLRENLLIQLEEKGLRENLSYRIITNEFDDFIHYRIGNLAKTFSTTPSEIRRHIRKDIARCNFHPATSFSIGDEPLPIPDLFLIHEEERWRIIINNYRFPQFKWASLDYSKLSAEEIRSLKPYLLSAKWLNKQIEKRRTTLRNIGAFLLKRQIRYFEGEATALEQLSLKEAADSLNLHESTITRAVSNKYLACPQGILSLRSFFSLASSTALDHIAKLVSEEDKNNPYSDENISKELKKKGISCARRTVSKYRHLLKIGAAGQRKK